jgi:hypothetical protein
MQDKPLVAPHVPSCDVPVGVAVGAADDVPLAVGVAEAAAEDEETILPDEERYQFASGSPRHSPTVTPRYPLSWII